jgi:CCR4-NOT transcriptional complex subunit CAF120
MFAGPKPKDRRRPVLTFHNVTQAFAVYPERPDLISRSTLIKLEGLIGDEETAGDMGRREGWLLIMPELEGGLGQAEEMLKWIVGSSTSVFFSVRDSTFSQHSTTHSNSMDGRKDGHGIPATPRHSCLPTPLGLTATCVPFLSFIVVILNAQQLLFLEREQAETLDVRDDRTSAIRSRLLNILLERMPGRAPGAPQQQQQQPIQQRTVDGPPSLPPIGDFGSPPPQSPPLTEARASPQLPPLSFGSENQAPASSSQGLTPISERSSVMTHRNTQSIDSTTVLSPQRKSTLGHGGSVPAPIPEQPRTTSPPGQPQSPKLPGVLNNGPFTHSPTSSIERVPSPPSKDGPPRRSIESAGHGSASRFGSTLSSVSNPQSSIRMVPQPGAPASPTANVSPTLTNSPPTMHSPPIINSASPPPGAEPVNRAMNHSPTSVLTSPHSIYEGPGRSVSRSSVLTSPFSNLGHTNSTASTNTTSFAGAGVGPGASPPAGEEQNFSHEAGALYYMQQQQQFDTIPRHKAPLRQQPTTISEGDDESDDDEEEEVVEAKPAPSTSAAHAYGVPSPVQRQSTPMAFHQSQPQADAVRAQAASPAQSSLSSSSAVQSAAREYPVALGRKPSGARAQSSKNGGYRNPDRGLSAVPSEPLTEEDSLSETSMQPGNALREAPPPVVRSNDDLDALAALSYLDVNDNEGQGQGQGQRQGYNGMTAPLRPHATERVASGGGPGERSATPPSEFKSSFAPSKGAAERKAKLEAQQAAHNAAVHRPGRANGRRKSKVADRGGWGESSDEEDEEDDEDDDDADSDAEPSPVNRQSTPTSGPASLNNHSTRAGQQGQGEDAQYSHLRTPRTLPQIPHRSTGACFLFSAVRSLMLTT